jgi:hypothetical protein
MILSSVGHQSQTNSRFSRRFHLTFLFLLHLILFHYLPLHLMAIIFGLNPEGYLFGFSFSFPQLLSFVLFFLLREYSYRYLSKDFFLFNNLLTYHHHVKLQVLISFNMDHTYKTCLLFFYFQVPLV